MPKKTRRTQPNAVSAPSSSPAKPGTIISALLAGVAISWLIHAASSKQSPQSAASPNRPPVMTATPPPPGTTAANAANLPGSNASVVNVLGSNAGPSGSNAAPPDVPPPGMVLDLPPAKVALNLGNWSYDHQNFRAAIDYYNEAIGHGIDNPDVRTDLGNAYRFSGDPKTALMEYATAQKESPSHENSLFNQGGCYLLLGDKTKAIQSWQEYLAHFPKGSHRDDAKAMIAQAQNGTPGP